ncbi:MAG TPA: site-specific DNA-methyltransferase [Chitinophagales bacterium]|nr:site-specific DNA-methyltransferase [Chitinophagales bacterium]
MKLYEALEKQLKKEPNYVTDNGELKKWVIINKAQNYDAELIEYLLDEPTLKEKFFLQVAGVLCFNQSLFIQFLEQKNYLNDSYTQYKNKVGLNMDGKYLKQRNEVALVWPFKDCVLEGGQSREEDKREEIFFNETLAQDEITQLLEPKVLTNAKRYTADGEKPLDQFNRNEKGVITDNLIIKGNNLLALHSLKEEFAGKVKLIYIDPPYNTGNDSFKYNDNFNHTTWLTFMKNRLDVAKKMLSDDGTIAISIDQKEIIYLQVLCDEVFGISNRKNVITVKRSSVSGAKVINPGVVNVSEYLVIYCKNPSLWSPNKVYRKKQRDERYNSFITNFEGNPENWEFSTILDAWSISLGIEKSKLKKYFKDDYEQKLEEFCFSNAERIFQFVTLDDNAVSDAVVKLKEQSKSDDSKVFILEREDKLNYYIYKGKALLFLGNRLLEIDGSKAFGEMITDIWDDVLPNDLHNEGGISLKKGKKPEKFLQRILQLTTTENDLVLDFFSGSGTAGAVSHKMNRQYILVEQMDYIHDLPEARLKNVINGEQSGISKAVNWQGGGEFVYLELKKYNQTFIEQIEAAQTNQQILEIWEEMKAKSFLNYNVDLQKQEQHIEEFKALPMAAQKQHLVSILDKNQLYVNRSSLNDKDFAVTEQEKNVTKDFYQMKK